MPRIPIARSLIACLSLVALLVGACSPSSAGPTPTSAGPGSPGTSAGASAVASPVTSVTPGSIGPSGNPPAGATPNPRAVPVDGVEIALDCSGEGQPTVILEADLGVPMDTWNAVVAEIAGSARICRYDRPPVAAGPGSVADRIVTRLRALLAAAGERPPYVLVGAGFAGLPVQLFARQHPDEVLGVVLVDAFHPEFEARLGELLTPEQAAARQAALEANPEGVTHADVLAAGAAVSAAPGFPPVSTVVLRPGLAAAPPDPAWPTGRIEALRAELAESLALLGDPDRPVVVAEASADRIQESEPDLVIEAIEFCLEGVR